MFGLSSSITGCITLAIVLGCTEVLCAEDEGELLALARAGQRAAFESARTLSCSVTHEAGYPEVRKLTGKYWRSRGVVHIQIDKSGESEDYYWGPEGDARVFSRLRDAKTGQLEASAIRETVNRVIMPLDVWRYMSLEFDLYQALATSAPQARRTKLEGRDCVEVRFEWRIGDGVESVITYWLDIEHNYHAWKRVITTGDNKYTAEITAFAEPKPGIVFPVECRGTTFRGSQQKGASRLALSDLRINEGIPKTLLEVPALPHGTKVTDWLLGETYAADENWQKIPGTTTDRFERSRTPVASNAELTGSQSVSEAPSWTRWLIPGALGFLAAALLLWLYRRYRTRRESP